MWLPYPMQAIQRDGTPQTTLEATGRPHRGGHLAHAGLVMAMSIFIVLGPAAGQLFGRHYGFLREWIMFSGSGIGVLKGRFVLHKAGGVDQPMQPLEVMGLRNYPDASPDEFGRLVFEVGDLRRAAATVCDSQTGAARLSFDGWMGSRQGWLPLTAEDVCALPQPAKGDGSPTEGPFL